MMWIQVQSAWKLKYTHSGWHIAWLITGVCCNVVIVACNTTINLTCVTSEVRAPDWFVNETQVRTTGDRYRMSTSDGVYKTATLTINGNLACETLNVYCEVYSTTEHRFVHMHNTTLRFKGWSQFFFCYLAWAFVLTHCKQLPLKPWHSQVAFSHLKMCISKSTLTPQPLNGNHLSLQGTMSQTSSMWILTLPSTLYTLLTIILETLLSKRM